MASIEDQREWVLDQLEAMASTSSMAPDAWVEVLAMARAEWSQPGKMPEND